MQKENILSKKSEDGSAKVQENIAEKTFMKYPSKQNIEIQKEEVKEVNTNPKNFKEILAKFDKNKIFKPPPTEKYLFHDKSSSKLQPIIEPETRDRTKSVQNLIKDPEDFIVTRERTKSVQAPDSISSE